MKNILRRSLALLIIVMILVSSLSISSFAAVSKPQISNTGTRDEICTTFNGTTAPSYYSGTYSYANLSSLSASSLKSTLATLMSSTHRNQSSYNNCRDYAYYTDCENGNTTYVTTLYTSYSATKDEWTSGWNREHVWPKSIGGKPLGKEETEGGSDLHHIRPSESGVNSTRGNDKYGEASNGSKVTSSKTGLAGGYRNGTYYEPLDNVKGDVARICLYVYVRWGSAWGADSITEVFESVDVLLEWCALDPVDTWEMERNDVVESVQGNRNVFIDYPEFAWMIYGRSVPSNMTTPSGMAKSQGGSTPGGSTPGGSTPGGSNPGGSTPGGSTPGGSTPGGSTPGGSTPGTTTCTHAVKETVNAEPATCIDGYTGDVKCKSCGAIITKGQTIPANKDHLFDVRNEVIPSTETQDGVMSRHCFICGYGEVDIIPKKAVKPTGSPVVPIIIIASSATAAVGVGVAIFFIVRKKKAVKNTDV